MIKLLKDNILLYYLNLLIFEGKLIMSQEELEEIEKKLDLIDEMFEIEDEIIEFLNSKNSSNFIKSTIDTLLKDKSLIIQKLNKDSEMIEDFQESIKKHFTWIKHHIDDEKEDFINYRNNEINVFKAYCLFYTYAITSIHNYIEYEIVSEELIKYFKALKEVYC